MTFPTLVTGSRQDAERFIGGADDICISIRSPGHEPALLLGAWKAVLRMEYDDWQWDHSPTQLVTRNNDAAPFHNIDDALADDVIAFIEQHARGARRLFIHCEAGISRSVSTAMALSKCYRKKAWTPTWWHMDVSREPVPPNERVYRMVIAAFERRHGRGEKRTGRI